MSALQPDATTSQAPTRLPGRWGSAWLTVVLLALVVVAGAALTWAWGRDQGSGAVVRGPIESTTARTAGIAAAGRLTEKALSYRWQTLHRDMADARAVMSPGFRQEYDRTMARVRAQTVRHHITVRATAVASSAITANEREVEALVFVNQVTTTRGTRRPRVDQNRVVVTLVRGARDWQIAAMKAF